jgi:hypothetical protein
VGLLEEFPLRADHKREFTAGSRLSPAQVLDEFESIGPMQTPWQFAVEQGLMEDCKLMMEMVAHLTGIVTVHERAVCTSSHKTSSIRLIADARRLCVSEQTGPPFIT